MNNLFLHCIIITLIGFGFYILFYKVLFKAVVVKHLPQNNPVKDRENIFAWVINIFSLFASALVYATIGALMDIFNASPAIYPYLISYLFWIMIAACILFTAVNSRSSTKITLLHLIYWFIIITAFGIYFPSVLTNFTLK